MTSRRRRGASTDEESADDLSIMTVDSLANINKEQVKELWKEMSETKAKEANIYKQTVKHGGRDVSGYHPRDNQ